MNLTSFPTKKLLLTTDSSLSTFVITPEKVTRSPELVASPSRPPWWEMTISVRLSPWWPNLEATSMRGQPQMLSVTSWSLTVDFFIFYFVRNYVRFQLTNYHMSLTCMFLSFIAPKLNINFNCNLKKFKFLDKV